MYRIEMPIFNKPITPGLTRLDDSFRGIPHAQGNTVKNGKELIRFIGTPNFDTSNLPVFDYFHLETLDRDKRLWEWCKNDVHQIDGPYSPSNFSLFISSKVKDILTKYMMAKPSGYVSSKLKYQGVNYDYWIFYCFRYCTFDDIIFDKSNFQIFKDSSRKKLIADYNGKIENHADYQETEKDVKQNLKADIFFKKAVIKHYYDFLMLFNDRFFYISKRLKEDLEDNGITGIEFVEATDIEFQFLEDAPPV